MERIAIIGLGCRFSGGATDPEKFWDVLRKGESTWSEIPPSRFNSENTYHANPEKRGLSNVKGGHFLQQDLALFDASFFNLSGNVAATMDPQYRMELEVVYEAMENAGLPLESLKGSNTAVFAGACFRDYHDSLMRDPETLPQSFMTGNGGAMASNRISHFFDLQGPSLTVDTGCSTTLTALHLAVQSLRARESDIAIVSGASLAINPDMFVSLSDLGVLSSEGVSYSFDSRAHGYGRGEGVAAIILKRLVDAENDEDPVRAIICESSLNQDGKTGTITSPSQSAQSELIKTCYRRAGLNPHDTAYIEAHGTGTQAGDFTEASALAEVFSSPKDQAAVLFSSVKSVIGHTEAVSGLASVIKVVLALENQLIPPAARFEQQNPRLDLETWNMQVPTKLQPWPSRDSPRRASINNFGYGGANAHVILEAASRNWQHKTSGFHPVENGTTSHYKAINGTAVCNGKVNGHSSYGNGEVNGTTATNGHSNYSNGEVNGTTAINGHSSYSNGEVNGTTVCNGKANGHTSHGNKHADLPNGNLYRVFNGNSREPEELVFVLSAKDETAIEAKRVQLKNYITSHPQAKTDTFLYNLAYTLGSRRSLFKRSQAYLADSATTLLGALEEQNASVVPSSDSPRIGFVFTGQGAQWAGMGSQLIHSYPVFRNALFRADACMKKLGSEWSLIDELLCDAKTSRVNEMAFSLPICAAVQLALVELLRTWGVRPTAVTGHSSGEIAAAYAVGGLSFESVIAIAYLRGAISSTFDLFAQGKGGMLAVGLGRESAESYIQRQTAGMAVVACVNSQMSVTISGDIEALAAIETMLKADNVFARRLKVSAAFHSPHMAPVADAYTEVLEKVLVPGTPEDIMFSSSLTGDILENIDMLSKADYWVQNMLQAVEFQKSFSNLCLDETSEQKVDIVVEVGPHGALAGPIQQILTLPQLSGVKLAYMNCLTRGQNATSTMRQLACNLIRHGFAIDLNAVNTSRTESHFEVLHDLPPYPWTHQTRYWAEPRVSYDLRFRSHRHHDLLGSRLPGSNRLTPTWRHIIRVSEMPWVREHCVQSQIIYPGAGLICMALEGFRQLCHDNNENIETYKLRDIDISKALAIDEDGGVEVQMTILPTSKSLLGNEGWHEFRIYSCADDQLQWTEHCRGLIHGQRTASSITPDFSSSKIERSGAEGRYQQINPDSLFESLRRHNIEHGPVFRNIRTIEPLKTGMVEVFFQVADTAATMPKGYQHSHLIHPTTLDSIILVAYSATCSENAGSLDSAYVPRSIKQLTISSNICADAGHVFQATSTLHQLDSQILSSSVVVCDGNVPLLELDRLDCQSLGGKAVKNTHLENDRMRGFVSWSEDITLNNPKALVDRLRFPVDATEAKQLRDLKHACLHYMRQALNSPDLPDGNSMEPHLRKFVFWMQQQLQSNSSPEEIVTNGPIESFLADVATATVNGEMVTRLGSQLIPILRGETTTLELMRQGDLLTRFYQNALKINRSYWQAAEIIKLCTHKNPRAQVLEIGAGTGSGTRAFFNAIGGDTIGSSMAPFEHYTFTDISAGFFEAAKSMFNKWEHMMSFRKLDIEIDPEKQGFEPGSYDIILAAQCLHATANMSITLSHVRKLLRPGGKLILVETTHDHTDLSFSFGLLSGWWLGEEEERKLTPNLTKSAWSHILKETGFTGIDIEVQDCESDELYMISTMMSSAIQTNHMEIPEKIALVTLNTLPPKAWISAIEKAMLKELNVVPEVVNINRVDASKRFCVILDEADAILSNVTSEQFEHIKGVLRDCEGALWVSRGGAMESSLPHASLQIGLLRTLRTETGGGLYASLDLDANTAAWSPDRADITAQVIRAVLTNKLSQAPQDFEYAERQGLIHTPRINNSGAIYPWNGEVADSSSQLERFVTLDPSFNLQIETPGMLDSLCFLPNPNRNIQVADDEIEIDPQAFGVNFRDIMVAMGQLQTNKFMGFDCSGTISRLGKEAASEGFRIGDRVCCLLRGHYTPRPRTSWRLVAHIPNSMEYEAAVAIPLAYSTAYGSIFDTAKLLKGERVLIHAAAGGVGQASIVFAQYIGAEIFATASTEAKRQLLSSEFGIPRDHIYSSRDSSFVEHIHRLTGGKGVDVIINSLSGNLLQESFNCMSPFGRFVEIGKRDLEQGNHLGMFPFTRNVSFMSYDLTVWAELRPEAVSRGLNESIQILGELNKKPMNPITTYPISSIEKAFRSMQTGQHSGKLVLTVNPEDMVKVKRPIQKANLRRDASYLIVGGMTGIGRSLCKWMVEHGAKNIVILSRSAKKDEPILEMEEKFNCRIFCLACDVSRDDELERALHDLHGNMPPIKGIIQGAMVLKDTVIERMSFSDFSTAVRPKVDGSWNLHRKFQDLDFFIMLSSSTGIIGNGGQGNYASGGVFQDALCHYRRGQKLPATTIDLGQVKTVGWVASTGALSSAIENMGIGSLSEEEVHELIEMCIKSPNLPGQIVTGIKTGPGAHWDTQAWTNDARFSPLKYRQTSIQPDGLAQTENRSMINLTEKLLKKPCTVEEEKQTVVEAITRKLSKMFMVAEEELLPTKKLSEIGVDSLVAVELRNWLNSQVGINMSIFELMNSSTLQELASLVLKKWKHK